MTPRASQVPSQVLGGEWIVFPGGELEGRRPKALCPACRTKLQRAAREGRVEIARRAPLCFQCYRTGLARERALRAAGDLDTSSAARVQFGLPFDLRCQRPAPGSATQHPGTPAPSAPEHPFPTVNQPRLAMLRAERVAVRQAMLASAVGQSIERQKRAQIAARLALRASEDAKPDAPARAMTAIHAAELQFPESWLPFVVGRG